MADGEAVVLSKNFMKITLFVILIYSANVLSIERVIDVDLSHCNKEQCFNILIEKIRLSDDIKISFWVDTVFFDDGVPALYAMLNTEQHSGAIVEIQVNFALLTSNDIVLEKRKLKTIIKPYGKIKDLYLNYKPFNAIVLDNNKHQKVKKVWLKIELVK